MAVVGLYLVRNEVDIIELNLRYHLDAALDEAIVVDNGSVDGTMELLLELCRQLPLTVISDPGPYAQADLVTRMARHAARRGASWVIPIDADEFWWARSGDIRGVLARCPDDVALLRCEVVNFVQSRDGIAPGPTSLLSMTRRVPAPVGTAQDAQRLVESREIGFVEMRYPSKCISRADPGMWIAPGNHLVEGLFGREVATVEVECLHAPLRARSMLTTKIDQGRRAEEAGARGDEYWHLRRWYRLAREGKMNEEWAANSYRDGALDLDGRHQDLVEDDRLRAIAAPFTDRAQPRPLAPFHGMNPAVGAYLLAMSTVPGWFSVTDFRLMVEIDRLQATAGVQGDLLEIGVFHGKSAILLGYFARGFERLIVSDLFENQSSISAANREEQEHWYSGLAQRDFEAQYQRFHEHLPDILAGPSSQIDREAIKDSCRLVHIDGGHTHAVVREDIATAKRVLKEPGIVVLDDISTAHNPGVAVAAWEAVLSGELRPFCLTDAKLYASWPAHDGVPWDQLLIEWAASQWDLCVETHELAGYRVPRITERQTDAVPASAHHDPRTRLAVLEPLNVVEGLDATRVDGDDPFVEVQELGARLRAAQERIAELERERDSILATKTFRYTSSMRNVYRRLRSVKASPDRRTSS